MKKVIALIILLTLAGCFSTAPVAEYETTRWNDDGQKVEHTVTSVKQIKESLEASGMVIGTNGAYQASLSGAQDIAGIEDAKGTGRGVTITYACCGIMAILSLAALFLPDRLVTNSDALLGFARSAGMFAAVRWADASSGIMAFVAPSSSLLLSVMSCGGSISETKRPSRRKAL